MLAHSHSLPDDIPLRIALLAESCAAGVGRHVIDLAEQLHSRGHNVHIIHSQQQMDDRFRSGICRLRVEGVHALGLEMRHSVHPSDVFVVNQIRKYLVAHGPFDVVHCHSTKAGLLGRLAALGIGCPLVYTPHAFMTMSPSTNPAVRRLVQGLECTLAAWTDCIVCVSDEERHHAASLRIPATKLQVVANGIDVVEAKKLSSKRSLVRERWGIDGRSSVIGFVGRLATQKAPDFLLESFSRVLHDSYINAHLVMVGSGPLFESCRQQARDLGIESRVTMETELTGLEAMAGFDIFSLASRYEAFPYVLIEALAMALPIVSTAVGGSRVLVKSDENGFVTPVGAVQDFASALSRLAGQPQLRRRMGTASLQLSRQFTVERMGAETSSVYRMLQKGTARRSYQLSRPTILTQSKATE